MSPKMTLKDEMKSRALTYRSLGYLADLSGPYVCRVANGHRLPSKQAKLALAKALKISPDEFERILDSEVADK